MDCRSNSVALTRCADYHAQTLLQAYDRLWAACAPSLNLRGAQVLLKPNLITARRGLLACKEGR